MSEHVAATAACPAFVLLTAAFNEEAFIAETIKSVLAQVVLPKVWVIVSDASTDRTDEIVRGYAEQHSFIRFIRRNKDQNRGFASKVFALRTGAQALSSESFEFVGHLDADIAVYPSYFCDLLKKFEEDAALGLASGWYTEKIGGEFRVSRGNALNSVPGAIQMFRRECYEDVGGLLPIEYGGEDWYAEVMARKCGWQVRSFSELQVRHLREIGTANSSLRYCYHQGITDYSLGSHPMFELAKLARRITWRPYFVGAVARLLGFLAAHLTGKRMVPPDFVAFLRKEQMARLWSDPVVVSKS